MSPKRAAILTAALMLSSLVAHGCGSAGTGTGVLVEPSGVEQRVVFDWESPGLDPTKGRISTTLPDGTTFRGRYFEITQTVQQNTLAPLWVGWGTYWPNWGVPWGGYGYPDGSYSSFTRVYSGRVVATLESPSGKRMRCRFTLAEPTQGLAGGGEGDCQLRDGTSIEDAVLGPVS